MEQPVTATTVIAQTDLPGKVHTVNVVNLLGIAPEEIRRYMVKQEGDPVLRGEPIAENRPFIKWLKTRVPSPVTGTVENVSEVTGQVFLREPPKPLSLPAYLDGHVVEVFPEQGAAVETVCSLVQGIFGIGGEAVGTVEMAVEDPADVVTPERITEAHRGTVLIGGSLIGRDGLARARQVGLAALVVGGVHDPDLKSLLGRDLGVAITGDERVGFTLIITEGFGRIAMANRTFDLLASNAGRRASCSGATQIRAGVVRPEVIIPVGDRPTSARDGSRQEAAAVETGLRVGDHVRIIREPYFGRIGTIVALPADPQLLPTESRVRVLEAELGDGVRISVPRANVERLET
jgi:hypothetical protein